MSIVSDDLDTLTHPPTPVGSRRVSAFVGLPIVFGCALLGAVVGVTHPLTSFFAGGGPVEGRGDLRLATVKLVEPHPAAIQQKPAVDAPEEPAAVTAGYVASQSLRAAPTAVVSVSTGSVERSPSAGTSEDGAPVATDRSEVSHSEPTRLTGQSHRAARAKRLRRVLWRQARMGKPKSEFEYLFAPLLQKSK
jgi:hypothetical protein